MWNMTQWTRTLGRKMNSVLCVFHEKQRNMDDVQLWTIPCGVVSQSLSKRETKIYICTLFKSTLENVHHTNVSDNINYIVLIFIRIRRYWQNNEAKRLCNLWNCWWVKMGIFCSIFIHLCLILMLSNTVN
jgi:hypothetical protein